MTLKRRGDPETRTLVKRCARALADARSELKRASAGNAAIDDADFKMEIARIVGELGVLFVRTAAELLKGDDMPAEAIEARSAVTKELERFKAGPS